MLFVLPKAATANNWLHDCLSAAVSTIHHCVQAGASVPAWPNVLPVPHRTRLRRRTGLRSRLAAYEAAIAGLGATEHAQVLSALDEQNRIGDLLCRACDCECLDDLPAAVRQPAVELFSFAFTLLTDLGIRDEQYQAIFADMGAKVCPFCGCEYFDAPTAPREALDHYLAKSVYPFAGVSVRNLVPMGEKCNSRYKRDVDILRGANGRRRAFDPYGQQTAQITLDQSTPFEGTDGDIPDWVVEFVPNCEESDTWDEVFDLRRRYCRDVLDPGFKTWIWWFRNWCKAANHRPTNEESLLAALEGYIQYLSGMGYNERAFLRAAVFRMLRSQCVNGNSRLIALLIDIANQ